MDKDTRGEGSKIFSHRQTSTCPQSRRCTVKEIREKFGEISVDLPEFKRQGKVALAGDFN